jgi:hypothetical protein
MRGSPPLQNLKIKILRFREEQKSKGPDLKINEPTAFSFFEESERVEKHEQKPGELV